MPLQKPRDEDSDEDGCTTVKYSEEEKQELYNTGADDVSGSSAFQRLLKRLFE